MKLINRWFEKNGAGHVTLRPEDNEDMWHLYNLIAEGDNIRGTAIRRVQNVSSTGSTESHRVRTTLTIRVTSIEFSPASSQEGSEGTVGSNIPNASLHISGQVVSENQYVRMGAFHTLDIEPNRDVRIEKAEGWDSVARSRVEEAIVPGRGAEVAAVVCGEGTATFCLLSQHMTVVTNRISVSIPRKAAAAGTSQHEKGLGKFYATIYDSFIRHVPYSNANLKAIIIASPGWVRDAVAEYLNAEASKRGDKVLQRALKDKVVKVHVTSPHVHSLVEVLKNPTVAAQLKEAKFSKEGIALDKFFKMLGNDEMRAWYGPDHVCLAADRGAIGILLISDNLFRSSDPVTRKKYVNVVEAVQSKGGEVVIFSSMHESGQQLNQLTGIAAILTFPLDVEVVEAEEKEEAERRKKEEEEKAART
ncbi:pelota [Coprinopsis marcescibilis]|uniref:Protein DOM34 homolog n=1 Tax=Coprinopsis marcescibilis TaxID=230819 RepID=A0A5C3L9L2_COPMA|nr:pelota [Coprinopsis marcescibilis]